MTKSRISREELTSKVLAAVRQQPGCEDVKEVGVTMVEIVDGPSCWRASVIDSGGADLETASHAARKAEEKLAARFELVA